MSREKARYAAPGHVLVDDRETAREGWEAGGGIFIRHTDAEHSIAALTDLDPAPLRAVRSAQMQ